MLPCNLIKQAPHTFTDSKLCINNTVRGFAASAHFLAHWKMSTISTNQKTAFIILLSFTNIEFKYKEKAGANFEVRRSLFQSFDGF